MQRMSRTMKMITARTMPTMAPAGRQSSSSLIGVTVAITIGDESVKE